MTELSISQECKYDLTVGNLVFSEMIKREKLYDHFSRWGKVCKLENPLVVLKKILLNSEEKYFSLKNLCNNIMFKSKKFHFKTRNEENSVLSLSLFNIVLEILKSTIRKAKDTKAIRFGPGRQNLYYLQVIQRFK